MEVKSTFDVKYVLLHGQFIYIYIYIYIPPFVVKLLFDF